MSGIKIILLLVFLAGCKEEKTILNVNYYIHGEVQFPILNVDLQKEILTLITTLVSNSDDILKLFIIDSTIENIKQNETSIEIIFKEHNMFTSEKLGAEKVKKMLLPLSGDFIGNAEDPIITILLGDEEYFSGPYRNKNGFEKLMKIKNIITSQLDN